MQPTIRIVRAADPEPAMTAVIGRPRTECPMTAVLVAGARHSRGGERERGEERRRHHRGTCAAPLTPGPPPRRHDAQR